MPTDHALLAPSAAKRWMTCAPSARLEAEMPEKDTAYSREGTIAHGMAESILRVHLVEKRTAYTTDLPAVIKLAYCDPTVKAGALLSDPMIELWHWIDEAQAEGLDPWEMLETVSERYCQIVFEDYLAAKAKDPEAVLLVEQRLNLARFIPEGFGSSDAVIIYGRTLQVYDLKYGKGVKVSAWRNPQMMTYAVGAYWGPAELYDIDNVKMTIIQPRLDYVSTYELSSDELMDWAENQLKPAAEIAFQGEGDYAPGDHCRFCKAAPVCKALKAQAEGTMAMASDPGLLSDEDLATVVGRLASIKSWAAAVEAYALDKMLSGQTIPGYKIVEGRSVRTLPDTEAAVEALKARGFDPEDFYRPRELKTISDLEKQLKKKGFQEILGDLVVKPKGKPAIAPEDDPRPAYNSAEDDFKNVE